MSMPEIWATLYASKSNSTFLELFTFSLSSVGMIISIIALMLLILTAVLFAEWRRNYKNQLLIQFMIARFIYTFIRYFYDVSTFFKIATSYFYPIYLDKISMAYSELALVTWMCIFSKQMHDSLAKVFNIGSPCLWKVSLTAWFLPAIISIILSASYIIQDNKDIQFFILYLFLIKWPVLCTNAIFLISVLKSIIDTNKSKTESNRRIVFVMITLTFTFCFQQAVTDFYKLMYIIFNLDHSRVSVPVFFIFTNILTVYHCAFSILFWLFANKRTRILWGYRIKKNNNIHKCQIQRTCNTIA